MRVKKLIIPIIIIIIILSEIHEVVVEADNDHDQQVEVTIGVQCKSIRSFFLNIIILDHRQRETKRRHSPTVSPPPRSRRKRNKRFDTK